MKLLSTDRRVLRGREALSVYRVLTQVSPEVYGSKLAYVLVEASCQLPDAPAARVALLEEAVGVARALDAANPFRAKVLGRALEALQQERAG